ERGPRSYGDHEGAERRALTEGGDQAIEVVLVGARRPAGAARSLPPEGGVGEEEGDGSSRARRGGGSGQCRLRRGGPRLRPVPARAPADGGGGAPRRPTHGSGVEQHAPGQAGPLDEPRLVVGQAVRLDLVGRL